MYRLCINQVWSDGRLLEIFVLAETNYICVKQTYYIDRYVLQKNGEKILNYLNEYKYKNNLYIEFGNMDDNYTPAFSINIYPRDNKGHFIVEMNMQIDDIVEIKANHSCTFFVMLDFIHLEQLSNQLYNNRDINITVINDIE